jgi:hypothetical protein
MAQTSSSNPIAGLHKQKMYSLILAGVGLISLLLPWVSAKVKGFGDIGGGASHNGFGSWGLLVLGGVGAAIASCFIGDKTKGYDESTKKIALGGFGAMTAGGLMYLIRTFTAGNSYVKLSPGIGLFLGLAAGALGLLILLGMVKPPKSIDDKVDNLS